MCPFSFVRFASKKIDCDKNFFFQIQQDKCNKYAERPTSTIGLNHRICVTLFEVYFLFSLSFFSVRFLFQLICEKLICQKTNGNSFRPFTIITRVSIIQIFYEITCIMFGLFQKKKKKYLPTHWIVIEMSIFIGNRKVN